MEARTDTTKIDDRFHTLETEMDERFEDMETRIANVESSVLQIQNMLLLLLQQSGSPVSRSPGSSLYGDSNDAVVDDDDKDSNDAMVDDDDKGSNDAVVDDDNKDSPKLSSDLVIPSFEEAGRLKFECLSNDGIDEHMIWLIGLKNIFAREIPSMPKQYIVRLVMDGIHKSVMVIRRNQVVGGITYRPYVNQKFGEIAFCAITADEQVKGYGTRLMNHLKQHARDSDGLTHFLTYADNNAVGFFIKQGFTKEIHLEKDRWQGYIKHYDGVLMEYKIDPNTSRF